MNIEEYRDYCLSVKGATECMPFGENILVFKIMDKMFTFATLRPKNGNFWADMKCAPDKAEELIEQYGDIFWGPFSDKKHWITVYLEGDVPDKLIKELISHSVEEVIKKLSKKKQEEYKTLPFGAVWREYLSRTGVEEDYLVKIRQYESRILKERV